MDGRSLLEVFTGGAIGQVLGTCCCSGPRRYFEITALLILFPNVPPTCRLSTRAPTRAPTAGTILYPGTIEPFLFSVVFYQFLSKSCPSKLGCPASATCKFLFAMFCLCTRAPTCEGTIDWYHFVSGHIKTPPPLSFQHLCKKTKDTRFRVPGLKST